MKLLDLQCQIGDEKISIDALYPSTNIIDKTGIPYVYKSTSSTTDLAVAASEKLDPKMLSDVRLLILVTQSPDDFLPANAISVANKLNLNKETICFDLNQGCSGFVQALCLLDSLICKYNKILLITADKYRSKLAESDRSTRSVFSDGASASVWSNDPFKKIIYENTETNGGARSLLYQSTTRSENDGNLHMSGAEVWMFTKLNVVPQIIKAIEYCQQKSISIDNVYIHQASKLVVEGIKKELLKYSLNIHSNYEKYGNTVSSSIPFLISDNTYQFTNSTGVSILAGFGVGLTSSVIVYG